MTSLTRTVRILASRLLRAFKERSGLVSGFTDPEMHLWMLSDDTRSAAYEAAIARVVKKGDVVVDLGAGTGLLSMMACRAGAGRVYAIERSSVIDLARRIVADNDLTDKVVFLHADATKAELPERADVVVSETIGAFVFSEEIVRLMTDARARFLKPGGLLVPRAIRIFMTPIESFEEGIGFWERPIRGFDYRAARDVIPPGKLVPARRVSTSCHLGPRGILYDIDLSGAEADMDFRRRIEFTARRAGLLHGFLGTWEAVLHDDVVLACDPEAPTVHWPPLLFRLARGIPVREGQSFTLLFGRRDRPGWHWDWKVEGLEHVEPA